ncbi:hypothetical protein [Streptomyces sp. NBC_00996]|uniref:hypothetical protein n=1 Tax=Streptomyces sp. NBC_00996 TaxID=2903710 RepID=UPI00386F1069|nr:hypothetical protein OG390_31995 [Streptomyces sp. NBC_00996]
MSESTGGRVDRINRSAVNFGDHGSAAYHEAPRATAADETTAALLDAVRTLREHLRLLTETDATTGLDGELAVVQGEIERTGRADPARLGRLRMRLETAAVAVAGLASTAAVVQVIAQLAG